MRKVGLFLVVILSFSTNVYANAGPVEWIGSSDSIIIPKRNENIEVLHEDLKYDITIHDFEYERNNYVAEVTAIYELYNYGDSNEVVKIAFPFDKGIAESLNHDITVLFDGKPVEYDVLYLKGGDRDISFPSKNEKYKWDKIGLLDFEEILYRISDDYIYDGGPTYYHGSINLIYFEVEFLQNQNHKLEVNYVTSPSITREGSYFFGYSEWEPIFHYYLEPASYWNDFGSLDIEINIPEGYELSNISLNDISESSEFKYVGNFETLPEDELIFTMAPRGKYNNWRDILGDSIIIIIALFSTFIIIAVVVKRKKVL